MVERVYRSLVRPFIYIQVPFLILLIIPFLFFFGTGLWNGRMELLRLVLEWLDADWGWQTLRNTIGSILVTLSISLPGGVLGGWWIGQYRWRGQRALILLLTALFAMPVYVLGIGWLFWLAPATWYGIDQWWVKIIKVGVVQGIIYLPLSILLCSIIFRQIPKTLLHMACLDTSWYQRFRWIIFPLSRTSWITVAGVVTVLSLQDITICDLVQLRTFQETIYLEFRLPDPRVLTQPEGTSILVGRLAWLSILPIGFLVWMGSKMMPFFERWITTEGSLREIHSEPELLVMIPRWKGWFISGIFWLGLGIICLIPIWVIGKQTQSWKDLYAIWVSVWPEYRLTLGLGIVTSFLAVPMAVSLAWFLSLKGCSFWKIYLLLLLFTPAPVTGISIVACCNREWLSWLYDSPCIYIYAWLLRIVPILSLFFLPFWHKISQSLKELIVLDGVSPWLTWVQIIWPTGRRFFLLAWCLGFLMIFQELGTTFLIQVPGYTTIVIRFFTMVHYGFDGVVAGVSLLLILTAGIPSWIFAWYFFKT